MSVTGPFERDLAEASNVLTANHFARREADGIVVDLYWDHGVGVLGDAFRIVVVDKRDSALFVLHRRTGRGAIQAFHHPFSAAASRS